MNIVFFGNTKFSVIDAEILYQHFGLSAVVTIPNSPVKTFAQQHNIVVIEARKLDKKVITQIATLSPDFLVVADYGLFLPKTLLELPKYAAINVHHSLLPKHPGPTPAPAAILAGDTISGVSVIKMAEKIDAGDILAQEEYTLKPDETTPSLLTALNNIGAKLAVQVINDFVKGTIKPVKQDQSKSIYTPHFTKDDGYIDLTNPPSPEIIDRMIRAYYPWPGVWGKWKMKDGKWKILKLLPGKKIQVEGKKPMSYKDFLNGYPEVGKDLKELLTSL